MSDYAETTQTRMWAPTVDLDEGMNLTYEWIKRFDREGNFTEDLRGSPRL